MHIFSNIIVVYFSYVSSKGLDAMMQRVSFGGPIFDCNSFSSLLGPQDVSALRYVRDGNSQPLTETTALSSAARARALFQNELVPTTNHLRLDSNSALDSPRQQMIDPSYFLLASGSFNVDDGDRRGGGNTDGCESDSACGGSSNLVSYAAKVRNSALLSGRVAPGRRAQHSADASTSSLASAVEGASSTPQSRPGSHSSSLDRQRSGSASASSVAAMGTGTGTALQPTTIPFALFHEAHDRRKSKLVDCRIHELRCFLHFDGSQKAPGNCVTPACNGALLSPSAICINYQCCACACASAPLADRQLLAESYAEEQFELLVTDMKTRSVKAFDLQGRFRREFGAPPGTSSSTPLKPYASPAASAGPMGDASGSGMQPSPPTMPPDGATPSGGVYGIDIAMHPLTGQILVLEPHPKSAVQIFDQSGALLRTFSAPLLRII